MTRHEYLKLLEKELHNINKLIDQKILSGEDYFREARDHRILMRKVRQHTQKSFFTRLFPTLVHY